MANKKSLLGGSQIKVENVSGFDKSRFNALTAPLGAIVPIAKQLMIPGKFNLSIAISAQLPPLATDAFLRTHLKVEAFLCPLRLCYGGFESFFSGSEIARLDRDGNATFERAKLPYLNFTGSPAAWNQVATDKVFGAQSLMDYFNVKVPLDAGHVSLSHFPSFNTKYNIFPFLVYQLIYNTWYRNKLIEKPLFSPHSQGGNYLYGVRLPHLPYEAFPDRREFPINLVAESFDATSPVSGAALFNGDLFEVRQRNYGYDYFTTALPSAQEGNPMSVDTSGGSFTISALRLQNSLQHFSEVNQLAGPDMVQANKARYGVDLSDGVAQRPILLGSADYPMFTSGVEQTGMRAQSAEITNNPFYTVGARYGRAHAEGSEFVCEGVCKEPSYLMVMASLVPEANYAQGIAHDMRIFTEEGSLVDLPVAALEQTGYEPVLSEEIYADEQYIGEVFGYQPRYMWHKAGGAINEVHGLMREGASLSSFAPQRSFEPGNPPHISTWFLKVSPSDLDNVMAVAGDLSKYGVMIDSSIKLFVSEPLGESALPSLVDPAEEHGYSVYVRRGGQNL